MFIRCSDGQFYRDPVWVIGDDRVLTPSELSYRIKRSKTPSWTQARRGIGDFEIRPLNTRRDGNAVFGVQLLPAVIFGIKFVDAPPPPQEHLGWVSDVTGVDDDVTDFPGYKARE